MENWPSFPSRYFRCGSRTVEPNGVDRKSWRWAPSRCRMPPPPPPCSPSVAPLPPPCSWTPGCRLQSPPPLPYSLSQASWPTRRACQPISPLPRLQPSRHPCPPLSSTPRHWDTAPTCPTWAQCAHRPPCTSAQLIPGTPVSPLWGWRPRNIFSRLGRHGDAVEKDAVDSALFWKTLHHSFLLMGFFSPRRKICNWYCGILDFILFYFFYHDVAILFLFLYQFFFTVLYKKQTMGMKNNLKNIYNFIYSEYPWKGFWTAFKMLKGRLCETA